MKKVLIAGASGLVGAHALRHFMQLPGWEALGVSRRARAGLEAARLVRVDLLDGARCAEVFGAMRDVTHLVYAALYEKPGLIAGWRDPDQMSTNLAMLENLFEPLEAAGGLGQVAPLHGTKAYGVHPRPVAGPARARPARPPPADFFWPPKGYPKGEQRGQHRG